MQEVSLEQAVDQILVKDLRYARDAYIFLREALDHTQKSVSKPTREGRGSHEAKQEEKPMVRHVTPHQLLEGIRVYALEQFGPMVTTVFEEWGIHNCTDFGEIVFNMVEIGLLAKTEKDSREDFKNGYKFDDAFRKPFLPESKKSTEPAVQ